MINLCGDRSPFLFTKFSLAQRRQFHSVSFNFETTARLLEHAGQRVVLVQNHVTVDKGQNNQSVSSSSISRVKPGKKYLRPKKKNVMFPISS